jgi:hypothetical protein
LRIEKSTQDKNMTQKIPTDMIADSAVTTAKIADSAVTTAKIADDAVTLVKMASGTAGNLITYDASGDPAAVSTGTANQVLTSNGAGAAPTFQDAGSGGKVLQVVQSVNAGVASTSSTSLTGSGISASITPSATSSKVLAMVQFTWSNSGSNTGRFSLLRGATNLTPAGSVGLSSQANRVDSGWSTTVAYSYLDSPSTTSSTTYEISFMATSGTTYIGDNSGNTHDGCIIITLMEIGA